MQDPNPFAAPETIEVGNYTKPEELARLLKIAKAQRSLMLCILSYIILVILIPVVTPLGIEFAVGLLSIILVICSIAGLIYLIVLTNRISGITTAVIFGLGFFVPLVGLLLALIMNGKANRLLKDAGFKIGLLGANIGQIQQAIDSSKPPTMI